MTPLTCSTPLHPVEVELLTAIIVRMHEAQRDFDTVAIGMLAARGVRPTTIDTLTDDGRLTFTMETP